MTLASETNIQKQNDDGNTVTTSSEGSGDESEAVCLSNSKAIMTTRRSRFTRRTSLPSHEKHYVEHNYHDHSHDPIQDDPQDVEQTEEYCSAKKRRGHRGGVAVPFPEKLHYMLSRMDQEGTSDVVSWQPHGRCFIVHNAKDFVEDIMPR